MAVAKEFLGLSLLIDQRSPRFLQSTRVLFFRNLNSQQKQQRQAARRRRRMAAALSWDDVGKASEAPPCEKAMKFKVRAVLTVRNKRNEGLKEALVKRLDALFADRNRMNRNVVLELVSTEVYPKSGEAKRSSEAAVMDWSKTSSAKTGRLNYTAELEVAPDFGEPGAIAVTNNHQNEFFLESVIVEGFASGPVHFPCNSWVQSTKDHPSKRIFFFNTPYLSSETPPGLKALREEELQSMRGDGKGVRKQSDRIYDYDVYNDLGNPDKAIDLARATLGGEMIPYPRRCRTGRHPTDTDMKAESRVEEPMPVYVPRDEQLEESKVDTLAAGRLKAVLHNLIPGLMASVSTINHDFKVFSDIDNLYKKLPRPGLVSTMKESAQGLLRFDTPKIVSKDKYAWLRDDEFARQAVAGIHPVSIQRMTAFPPVSKLDPEIYGSPESALKEEHIVGHLYGLSVQQALEEKKLFIVDYHDSYLPFLDRINALDGRKAYATRTIYFLTHLETLKPIAIELSLAPGAPKRVVTPPVDATSYWIWQLAKAHVCSNDSGIHQLVNHWLRTHACLEPFILAAHRQLSAMHPIYKLLDPHMRYTLQINALARQSQLSADGIIESCFTAAHCSMEMSAAAYRDHWRFDLEGLPADLIRRGMAVPDPKQPHGLKLVMEDYPYAADGLLIWAAIENYVKAYVGLYYLNPGLVANDQELQAWFAESINVGHADLRHATWWPKLSNNQDLVSILATLIWLASAHHAALNFGQYSYGGYVPNHPPLMRRLIPEETDVIDYARFLGDPQGYFLSSLPNLLQATKFMAVVDTVSTHSSDEEYIGERKQPSMWSGDGEAVEAFYGFAVEIQRIDKEIEKRNADPGLRNRCGAGVMPYELLAPSSEPGVTCRGVPNSVSI